MCVAVIIIRDFPCTAAVLDHFYHFNLKGGPTGKSYSSANRYIGLAGS